MAESRDEMIVKALVAQGKLAPAQVLAAQERARDAGVGLVMALIQGGYVTTNDIASAAEHLPPPAPEPVHEEIPLGPHSDQPLEPAEPAARPAGPRTLRPRRASLSSYQVDPEALRDVPKVVAEEHRVLPLQISDDRILVAMADSNDVFAMDAIRSRTRRRVEAVEVDEAELMRAIDEFYAAHAQAQVSTTAATKDLGSNVSSVEDLTGAVDRTLLDMLDQGHVIEIVRAILREAIRLKASDIHIEPRADCVQIRYRIDGRLTTHTTLPSDMLRFVVSRIRSLRSATSPNPGFPRTDALPPPSMTEPSTCASRPSRRSGARKSSCASSTARAHSCPCLSSGSCPRPSESLRSSSAVPRECCL